MIINSNRLFSSFLSVEDMASVKLISYFPLIEKENNISLVPSDHCYYYPLSFDYTSRKINNGELNFFNTVVFENYKPNNLINTDNFSVTKKSKQKNSCLIVNLIDNCYGHSFLKLLNLLNIYNEHKDQFDIWVICPKPLAHFIAEDKFYLVNVKLGFEEAKKCPDLQPIIDSIKTVYSVIDFVTLDTYATYSNAEEINDFFGFLPTKKTLTKKYITFYYRADYFRSWAGRQQSKRITDFFNFIKPYFPDSDFVVAGDKDELKFPAWITDIRTNAFGKEVDLKYNEYFNNSHMVIGLIGSNMLQPSMTCDFTIHLVPLPKITIVAEELFNHSVNTAPGWFKNIYLFGNDDLRDLTSEKLGEQVIMLYLTYVAKKYKEQAFNNDNFNKRVSQKEFYNSKYGFFNLEKAAILKDKITKRSFKNVLLKFRFSKLIKLLRLG